MADDTRNMEQLTALVYKVSKEYDERSHPPPSDARAILVLTLAVIELKSAVIRAGDDVAGELASLNTRVTELANEVAEMRTRGIST